MTEPTPEWARALGRVPSGLFIATAGVGDEATGFLASWVQQAGFEPPVITLAVKSDRHVAQLVRSVGAFCVSVLDTGSKGMLGHFARGFAPDEPAFEGVAIETSAAGVPYLTDALAHLHCLVVGEVEWSDHTIFCGAIEGGGCRDETEPMVHTRKSGLSY